MLAATRVQIYNHYEQPIDKKELVETKFFILKDNAIEYLIKNGYHFVEENKYGKVVSEESLGILYDQICIIEPDVPFV